MSTANMNGAQSDAGQRLSDALPQMVSRGFGEIVSAISQLPLNIEKDRAAPAARQWLRDITAFENKRECRGHDDKFAPDTTNSASVAPTLIGFRLPGGLLRFAPTIVFFVATLLPTLALAGIDLRPDSCNDFQCVSRDRTGMLGLTPKRVYSIVYDGDKSVCHRIGSALNDAISEDATTVENKMPKLDLPKIHHAILADNPLFSDQIFIRWNYLAGDPGVAGPDDYDGDNRRWTIVPFMNDGHPYLVTRKGAFSNQIMTWDIPLTDLQKKDWKDPLSYLNYHYLEVPDPNRPGEKMDFLWTFKMVTRVGPHERRMSFPKLSPKIQLKTPWYGSRNARDSIEFAKIDGNYYGVFVGTDNDIIYVVDFRKKPGDDLCYLKSNFPKK